MKPENQCPKGKTSVKPHPQSDPTLLGDRIRPRSATDLSVFRPLFVLILLLLDVENVRMSARPWCWFLSFGETDLAVFTDKHDISNTLDPKKLETSLKIFNILQLLEELRPMQCLTEKNAGDLYQHYDQFYPASPVRSSTPVR